MQHGWHKRPAEMHPPVLQEREPDQVMSLGRSLLQCHPGLIQAQHPSKYDAGHNHHP